MSCPGCTVHESCRELAALVLDYRLARHAWELDRERVALGYRTEEREYQREHPSPLFRDWLIHRRRPEDTEPMPTPLPSRAYARTTDPDTSHAAAASVNLRESQQLVLALLAQGPCTDVVLVERARAIGATISESGVRTRRAELVAAGLARDTEDRVRLPSGRYAAVWEVVP